MGLLPEPGIDLLGSYWPFIMAISGTGFNNGLFIYIMRQFLRVTKSLEEAAYIDGANPYKRLSVMVPGQYHICNRVLVRLCGSGMTTSYGNVYARGVLLFIH